MAHGAKAESSSAAGSRMTTLLKTDPLAIFHTMGNFAARVEPMDVFRRHRRVVDHRARGLGPPPWFACPITSSTEAAATLGDGRDIVEKCQKTACHVVPRSAPPLSCPILAAMVRAASG